MLTAENVGKIFEDCLFPEGTKEENLTTDPVLVDGVTINIGFDPVKIKLHKEDIYGLLAQLPEQFQELSGGGWSFLNACLDKDGKQWGEHIHVEQLLALGIAADLAAYLMPREMWPMLPGGMPYFVVKNIKD